jgi:hypothetical protein
LWCKIVVDLWWDAGGSVVADGRFSGVEKHANFLKFIFAARGSVSSNKMRGSFPFG